VVDVKYYGELKKPSEFNKDALKEFLATGYATEQKIDGEIFIKMTSDYFEDLGEYIILHPVEMCRDYWETLIEDTKNCSVIEFIKRLCETHNTIKKLTKNKVDFCNTIGEEL